MSKYWIGSSGNWNDVNHWSNTSGGSPVGEVLGTELVTNGTFATDTGWNKGVGCTISGGTLNMIGTNISTTQSGVFTTGRAYKITFDVTNCSGSGQLSDGNGHTYFSFSSNGSYSTATSYISGIGTSPPYYYAQSPLLYIDVYNNGSFSIDNISIKEVTSLPLPTDDVFFNNLSFTGTSTVTVNSHANCLSMTWTGLTQNVTLSNSDYNLNVYGNLYLLTGLTWKFISTGYLYFKATDSRTITTNGIVMNSNISYFDGVGGKWTNQDNWNAGSTTIMLTNGTWNTNDYTITTSFNIDTGSNNPKTLTTGNSIINLGSFNPNGYGNLTITPNTSTFNFYNNWFTPNGSVFYTINIINLNSLFVISSSLICTNLNYSNGANLQLNSNIYVTGTLTLNGYNSTTNRLLITSYTIGTTRTITAPNIIASNVDFRDISVPIDHSWDLSEIAGGSGDCGGNLNITFTSGQTQYFKHTSGAVSWSNSSKWFTSSGGLVQGRVPLPQDDATFDENSFSGTSTLTINVPRIGRSLDMSMITQIVNISQSNNIDVYGSFILTNKIGTSFSSQINLMGRGSFILNSYNNALWGIFIYAYNGFYLNMSNLVFSYAILGYNGTFDFNDYDVNSRFIKSGGIWYLGNGTISLYTTISEKSTYFDTGVIYTEGSTIKLTAASGTNNITFSGDNNIFNKVWLSGTHTGNFDITGNNTFAELKIDAGRKVRFTAGTTNTVGTLIAEGTSTSGITISSVTSSPHTLVKSGTGTVTTNYCNISYSTATSSFRARNSVNGGNNTGWVFSTGNTIYWVGDSGYFHDPLHWSDTSGGSHVDRLSNELVVNGDFSTNTNWTSVSGYVISGGTLNINTTVDTYCYQSSVVPTRLTMYKIVYTISNYVSGAVRVSVQNIGKGTPRSSNGTYTEYIQRGGDGYEVFISNVGVTSLSIDNISVKEVYNFPNLMNDIVFDQNSFTIPSIITMTYHTDCFSMIWSDITQNVTLISSTSNLNMYGSLTLWTGLTMNFSNTGYLYLNATDPQTITTNGVSMMITNLYLNGIGGSWTNQDNWDIYFITWISGTWTTNNKTINTAGINTTLSGTRIWNLGSSDIYTGWLNSNGAPITIYPGTSTVYTNGGWFRISNLNNVVINRNGAITIGDGVCNNLTLMNGAVNSTVFILNGDITVFDTLTLSGYNSTNYRPIIASTIGITRKITTNNVIASNVDFRDINLSGSTIFDLSNITGGSGDAGGNSGITFTAAQPQYFKHTSGAVNWSDSTKWFTSSGGLVQGRVPLPQDDATFDENSFSGISTLSFNVPRIGRSLDMSLVNTGVTVIHNSSVECYGNFILGNNITFNGTASFLSFMGIGYHDINTFGKNTFCYFRLWRGFYTLKSNLITSSQFRYFGTLATFDMNDFDMTCQLFNNGINTNSDSLVFYMGNGTLYITIGSTFQGFIYNLGTLYPENSTIKFIGSGVGNMSFIGFGRTYNKVWFSGTQSGNYDITGSNSFNELIIDAGRKVRFLENTTTTIKKLTALGTSDSGITITSITSGSTHNLLLSSGGTADVKFANISYSNMSPNVLVRQSTDLGGNSGWTFSAPRYWIGGTGNWSDLSHWSATSGGVSGSTFIEQVFNGTFDSPVNWLIGTNWSINSGSATHTLGADGILAQNMSFLNGEQYRLTIVVSSQVGHLAFANQNGQVLFIGLGYDIYPVGTTTLTLTCKVNGIRLNIYCLNGSSYTIDSISIQRIYSTPTSSSDVIFDQNSFSGTSTVTINTGATCATMDWTGIDQNVTLTNTFYNLNVYGSLILYTGLTWNFTGGILYLKSTTSGNLLTTNGLTLNTNKLYFDGVGGTWTNQDDMNLGATYIGFTNGSWHTNDKNITTTGLFEILAGTKTLTLGSSMFKIGAWSDINLTTTTGLTFNCGTSTVWITSDVEYYQARFYINSSTHYNLKVTGKLLQFYTGGVAAILNITNLLTISGSTNKRVLVTSGITGAGGLAAMRTIIAKNVDLSYVDFLNIKGSGTANWDVSNIDGLSGDLGGNSGITFTPSQTLYFTHTSGSCVWDDNTKWFLSDRITPSRIPLAHDDVVFDELSFIGSSTVNINTIHYQFCRNFNTLNINQSVIFSTAYYKYITGNIDVDTLTSFNFNVTYILRSCYINTNNVPFRLSAINDTATYNLLSDFSGELTVGAGTFNTNNYTLNLTSRMYIINQNAVFNAGSSTINLYGALTFSMTGVFNCGTSTVNFFNTYFTQAVEYGSQKVFYNVNTYGTNFSINKSATFNNLNISGTAKFYSGLTFSFNSLTTTTGSTITSLVPLGNHNLLKLGSGLVDVKNTTISYSSVSGSTLIARNSTDAGNNNGWIFPAKRYWIGGTGNWNDPTHWSNSSGGVSGDTISNIELLTGGNFEGGLIGAKSEGFGSVSTWTLNTINPISGTRDGLLNVTVGYFNRPYVYFNTDIQIPIDIYVRISFDYKINSGSVIVGYIYYGGNIISIAQALTGTTGTYVGYVKSGGINNAANIYFNTTGLPNMQIDNISIREMISIPTKSSDVIFDQNSFSGTSIVTINTGATCLTMDWTGINQNVTLLNSAYNLNLYGSLILYTGLTWTFNNTSHISIKTSTSMFIDTNGISMEVTANGQGLYFDGTGSYDLKNNLILVGNPRLNVNSGTFNSNSYDISCNQLGFFGTSIINMGSSTFSTIIYYCDPTVIFNCGTSTLKSLIGAYLYGMSGGNKAYYNIEYTGQYTGYIDGILSCNNFTFTTYSTYLNFNLGTDIIINGILTISGQNSTTNRAKVNSTVLGTQRKITASNVVASNVDFRDIYLSGSTIFDLSNITGGSGDAGGNSGITFTPSQTQYWYSGTGSWSDSTKWFTQTSGVTQGRIPLPQDDAIFDENSFSGISTVTVNVPRIGSLDMSLVNTGVTMTLGNSIECYGNFILGSNISLSTSNNAISLMGRYSYYLKPYNSTVYQYFIYLGSYTALSDINLTAIANCIFTLRSGTFDLNDFNMTSNYTIQQQSGTFYFGSGTLTTQRWGLSNGTVVPESSTLKLIGTGSANIPFSNLSPVNFNKVWFSGDITGSYDITGSNTFNELIIDDDKKVRFTEGTTTTINSLIAEGTSDSGITITSVTSGLTHTLVKTGTGAINVKYATISYSNASTPNVFRTRRSTNLIGNTGWVFPPAKYWIGGSGTWNDITHWSDTSGGSGITEILGPELCLNSGFTTTANWSFGSGGNVSINTSLGVCSYLNASGVNGVRQVVMEIGKSYKCTVEIKNYVIGQVYITDGNTGLGSVVINGNGTYSSIFTPLSTKIYIMTMGAVLTTLDLDSVSVKEVTNFLNSGTTVYFDQNSFSAPSTVSITDSQVVCLDMDWTGINQNVSLKNANIWNAYIYGSLILYTGLTWNFAFATALLIFKATQTGNFIKTNGIPFGGIAHTSQYITFDGIGGSWCNLDDMTQSVSGSIYIINGVWNTNGKTITFDSYLIATNGGLDLGSSTFYAGNGFGFSPGFQLTGGTSTIIASGDWGYANGQILYDVILNQQLLNYGGYYGGFTCKNLTRTGGNSTLNVTPLFSDIIVTDTFTINGYSPSVRTIIYSWSLGTQRKITANNVVASNVDFRDIYLSGSTIFNLTNFIGDCGGNSGITFTPSQTQYWHVGTGSWSDSTKWYTQTNGVGTGRVPLPQDDIIFDENSFDTIGTVTVDLWRIGRSLNMSGVTKAVNLTISNTIDVYGSFILNSGMTITTGGYKDIYLYGRDNFDISTYNVTNQLRWFIYAIGGKYTMRSDFFFYEYFGHTYGTLDLNDFNMNGYSAGYFNILSGSILYMGDGIITIRRNQNYGVGFGCNVGSIVYCENSIIKYDLSTSIDDWNVIFAGGGQKYNKVWFSGNHNGYHNITGNNTFNEIKIEPGRKVRFDSNIQTINRLISLGKPNDLIYLTSMTTGSTYTLNSSPNDWLVDYTVIQDSIAVPNKFAGINSVNSGNTTGWNYSTSKIRYWIGNSGTSTDTSHWSLQSNGVSGATVPTQSESAVFDRNSFTLTGQTVTLSGNTNLAYLYMDDVSSGLTLSSNNDLNIYDSLYLASGMTFNVDKVYFKSPYTGNVINTKNTILNTNEIYFDNITGMWTNGEYNFTTTANINHVNGTWSVNRIVTIKNYSLQHGTKRLLLDSSTFNVDNFDINTNSTNYTITPSISKIISSGLTMSSQTLYDVETNSFDAISPTIHNLTLSGDTWIVKGEPIITGTLQIDGDQNNRFLLSSDILRTQRSITAQNVIMSNVDIIDIKGNDWILTGTSVGDGGGNIGITFDTPTNQYWYQGSGNWNDLSKWTSRVPLLQDTAIFDQNSFTGTSTLNINMSRISGLNMSGVTQQVTMNDINVYGDINLNDYTKVNNLYLYGRNNILYLSGDTNVCINGNYTNQYNFKSNSLTLLNGTFNLGNYILEVNNWSVLNGILIPNLSTIKFNSTGSTNYTFDGGDNTYNNLWLSGNHTGFYDILGNNTFNNIRIDDGRKVRFESNLVQTINSLTAVGVTGITITSTSSAQHILIFRQYDPFLVFNHLNISNSDVRPKDRIYAVNSINSGNNTGWIFTDSPLFVWIQDNWSILVDDNGKFLW